MTKKQICLNKPAIAYYSGMGGITIHEVEYGIDDYLIFCIHGGKPSYHRLKINYDNVGDAFVCLNGVKIRLDECIREGVF